MSRFATQVCSSRWCACDGVIPDRILRGLHALQRPAGDQQAASHLVITRGAALQVPSVFRLSQRPQLNPSGRSLIEIELRWLGRSRPFCASPTFQ